MICREAGVCGGQMRHRGHVGGSGSKHVVCWENSTETPWPEWQVCVAEPWGGAGSESSLDTDTSGVVVHLSDSYLKSKRTSPPLKNWNALSKIEVSFPQRPHSVESIPYLDFIGPWWESQLYHLTATWASSKFFTLNFTSIKRASVTLISQDSKNWDGVDVPLSQCLAHRGMENARQIGNLGYLMTYSRDSPPLGPSACSYADDSRRLFGVLFVFWWMCHTLW